ncbi:phage holin family protein [Sorangium sp. So ce381]|uniref:phage holin family protein n=1 Tax=Sorangium sp. So ce381 TaxID=3133307 RepID=UPI003F5BEE41
MKALIIQALAAGLAVLVGTKILPGVRIRTTQTALVVAAVFTVLNLLLGWLVKFLVAVALLPAAILTLGLAYLLFGLVVNSVLLYATDKLIDDFEIRGLGPLFGTAALISFAGWLLPRLL